MAERCPSVIGRLHDPTNVQQTSCKCIRNTRSNCWTFAGSCKYPITDGRGYVPAGGFGSEVALNAIEAHPCLSVTAVRVRPRNSSTGLTG